MRKWILIPVFIILYLAGKAQNRNAIELNLSRQLSPYLDIHIWKDKYFSFGNQAFTAKIKNTSQNRIKLQGSLVAKTVCGTEVSIEYDDIILEPGDLIGVGDITMTPTIGVVFEKDCKSPETLHPYSNDFKRIEKNAIGSVVFRGFNATIYEEKKPTKTATNSNTGGSVSVDGSLQLSGSPTATANSANSQLVAAYNNAANNSNNDAIMKTMYSGMAQIAATTPSLSATQQQQRINQINQIQDKTNKTNNTIDAVGNALTTALNTWKEKEAQENTNKIESMSAARHADIDASDYMSNNTDLEKKFHKAQLALNLTFELPYSNKSRKNLFNEYFPKGKSDIQGKYEYINIPKSLPEILFIPTCKCFTENNAQTKYDSGFYYLRKSQICNNINFQGDTYWIKTNTKIHDNYDENKALVILKEAVKNTPELSNKREILNYYFSYLWILHLWNSHIKSFDDLNEAYDFSKSYTNFFEHSYNDSGYDFTERQTLGAINEFIQYYKENFSELISYVRINNPLEYDNWVKNKNANNKANLSIKNISTSNSTNENDNLQNTSNLKNLKKDKDVVIKGTNTTTLVCTALPKYYC